MNSFLNFFPENVMSAVGWTLIHSVWQLMALAIVLKTVFFFSKNSAIKKYWFGFASLLFQVFVSIITFLIVFEENSVSSITQTNLTFDKITQTNLSTPSTIASNTSIWMDFQVLFSENLNLLVTAWMIGMLFLSVRLMGGYFYTEQLRWKYTKTIQGDTLVLFNQLLEKVKIKKGINLLESSLATSPMTIGFLQPVILLPIGLITGLSNKELEAVLAHELAHIKRHDYLVNIIQSLVEILFFFHPATWWISANIREERENCCDDLAIELCGNNVHLAKALTKVEIFQQQTNMSLAMGFTGKKQTLLRRVHRILGIKKTNSVNYAGIIVMSLFALTTFVFVNIPNNADAQTSPQKPKTSKKPVTTTTKVTKKTSKTISVTQENENNLNFSNGNIYVNGERIHLSPSDSIKVAKELQAIEMLEKRMEPHQKKIETLSNQIAIYSQQINEHSQPMNNFSIKISELSNKLSKLGEKQGSIAEKMISYKEGTQARKNAEQNMNQIEKEMKIIEQQMEKYGDEMEKIGERMNFNSAPIDSLSKLIELEAKPIEALGKEIEFRAKEIEKTLPASVRAKINSTFNAIPDFPEAPTPPTPSAPASFPTPPSPPSIKP